MKAAILNKINSPLIVDEVDIPERLQYGQVLVDIFYSGVCGSQLGEIVDIKGQDKYLPHLLGHEASGKILDIGTGVKKVSKGDHVVLHWKKGSGIESETPKYLWKNKIVNAGLVTTFNEKAVVSENRITKIDKYVNLETAALYGCALTTGFGVINNDAKSKIGESILIIGAGGVGLSEILAAKLVSNFPIIAVDIFKKKLRLAKEIGADFILLVNKNLEKQILKINNNKKIDIVIENTGIIENIEFAYNITKSSGSTILVGVPKFSKKVKIGTLPLHFDKVLKGSHGGNANPSKDIPNYMNFINKKKINLKKLITNKYDLRSINDAIYDMKIGKCLGRAIIKMK